MEYTWTATVEKEVEQDYGVELDASDTADAYTEAIQETYEAFEIQCPLHVWENGFVQGDAGDDEVIELAKRLGCEIDAEDLDSSALWEKLNSELRAIYEKKLVELAKVKAEAE